jgi:hypothetical protein
VDDELVRLGRYARLVVPSDDGPRSVVVGFLDEADGSLLVAAGRPGARWAAGIGRGEPIRVTIGERSWEAIAEELGATDPDRSRAVRELILRYGTPAEGLGRGPVFRLRPLTAP